MTAPTIHGAVRHIDDVPHLTITRRLEGSAEDAWRDLTASDRLERWIGRWEGDTLVVETVGISPELEIDTGFAHSDKFRLVERIHLDPADANVLINEMWMEDPEALAEPFIVSVRYRRDRYGKLIEFQCAENDRNPIDEEGHTLFE